LTPILSLLEILLQPPIALGHLLLAKLVTILFLLQHEQQIFFPVTLQAPRDLFNDRRMRIDVGITTVIGQRRSWKGEARCD
jgi:hypothetical protein